MFTISAKAKIVGDGTTAIDASGGVSKLIGATNDITAYALQVEDVNNNALLYVRNDGVAVIGSSTLVSAAALKVKGRLIVSTQEVTANDNYNAMIEVGVGNGVLFSDGTNGASLNNQLGRIFGDGGLQIYGRNNASATKFELNAKSSANRMVLTSDDANDIFTFRPTGVLQHTQVVGNDGFNIIKSTLGTATNAVYSALSVINADATANRLSIIGFTAVENTARHAFIGAKYIDGSNGDLILGNKAAGTEAIRATIYSDGNFGINTSSAATARLHVVGTTSAAGAYALKVDNSSNSPLFCVQNDRFVGIGISSPTTANALFQVSQNSYNEVARFQGYFGGAFDAVVISKDGNLIAEQYSHFKQSVSLGSTLTGTAKLLYAPNDWSIEFGNTTINNDSINSFSVWKSGYNKAVIRDNVGANIVSFHMVSGSPKIAVGTTTPDNSAIADFTSTTQGVLLPRMTTTEINAIASPANGLMVYNTTLNHICFYDSTGWKKLSFSNM